MRALVLVLVLLAGAKVAIQERFYRTATEDAPVAAYRDRAIDACQKHAKDAKPQPGTAPLAWTRPASIDLVIGRRDLDVRIWDVDNELWAMRYKHPFLVLRPGDRAQGLACQYDLTWGGVQISQL